MASLALFTSCGPRVGEPLDGGALAAPGTFRALAVDVFLNTCAVAQCHAGEPPPRAPMSLEEGRTFAALVGAPSQQAPGLRRVAPFDARSSYLVHKLRGTAGSVGGVATRMPLGKPALDEALIEAIEAWIDAGAPND